MTDVLRGRKIAFLVANSGVEQIELTTPWAAVQKAGGDPVLIAPKAGAVQAFHHDVEPGDDYCVDVAVTDVHLDDYTGLVLPGGTTNADTLRTERAAVRLVAAFAAVGKPVATICHAPWILIEAGLVANRALTSWPSLRTDISNAGGHWIDEELVVCTNGPFTLVTSRGPDDLSGFTRAANAQFGGQIGSAGRDSRQASSLDRATGASRQAPGRRAKSGTRSAFFRPPATTSPVVEHHADHSRPGTGATTLSVES